jgi:hypothetical protein
VPDGCDSGRRFDLWRTDHTNADDEDTAPCLQCWKGYGGAAAVSQKRRRVEVLRSLHSRLTSERERFDGAAAATAAAAAGTSAAPATPGPRSPRGAAGGEAEADVAFAAFDPRTATAIAPAEWPPRPATTYSHLSGSLTRRRPQSQSQSQVQGRGPTPSTALPSIGSPAIGALAAALDPGLTGPGPAAGKFDPEATLRELQQLPLYTGQVAHIERIAASAARFDVLARPLAPPLQSTLDAVGLGAFFAHQAAGINAAREGHHVMLSTSTSSGKSLV